MFSPEIDKIRTILFVSQEISPPRLHTSCSSKIISASASVANMLHRAHIPCGTCRKSTLLRHSFALTGPWQIFVFMNLHAENERCFCLGMWTAGICTELFDNVLKQVDAAVCLHKSMFIRRLPHRAQSFPLHVTTPTLSVNLSRFP